MKTVKPNPYEQKVQARVDELLVQIKRDMINGNEADAYKALVNQPGWLVALITFRLAEDFSHGRSRRGMYNQVFQRFGEA